MKLFRFRDHGPTVPRQVEVSEVVGYEDYYTGVSRVLPQFPHCDSLILHSPGVCEYCDRHPDWQALRSAQGIAFSDTSEEEIRANDLIPCPSTVKRPAEVRDQWYGNVPKPPL